MTLRLDDVAEFDQVIDRAGSGRRTGHRAPFSPTRRDFLKGVALGATTLALNAIGLFPTARPAFAWDWNGSVYPCSGSNCCSGLGDWVLNDNCYGCNQKLYAGCDTYGFHKGPDHGCYYKVTRSVCQGGTYDGWYWKYGGCCGNGRKNQKWRCTDGWYRDDCDWGFNESICRWRVSSGDAC